VDRHGNDRALEALPVLQSLTIRNYKSLHDVSVKPPPFFALVGANAAGKTNFVDAIEFLSIVAKSGLASAITEKGGYENICFRRARRSKGAIQLACTVGPSRSGDRVFKMTLDFTFRAVKEAIRSSYRVEREEITLTIQKGDHFDPFLSINRGSKSAEFTTAEGFEDKPFFLSRDLLTHLFSEKNLPLREDDLLAWTQLRGLPPFDLFLEELASYRLFQLSPGAARRPGAASGSQELGKYGENLPAALEWLQREKPGRRGELLEYLKLAVPTVEKIETAYVETRELGLFLKEAGIRRKMFSSELSDGTLRTLAMFLPLVDPRYPVVVIEEPENNVHPWVVRHFVDACRARSTEKQIILTTHSPVLVSKLQPGELFVADRVLGKTRIYSASEANVELNDIISRGVQDLGSYWDSGAMKAVPSAPQFDFMDDGGG
jgi:predicted ATPase